MLREKRISAVKQSSSWMRVLFKALPPISTQVFISTLTGGFSEMITSFTCKEKLSKLKLLLISDNRASGGAAVSSFIYRLYAFIVAPTGASGLY